LVDGPGDQRLDDWGLPVPTLSKNDASDLSLRFEMHELLHYPALLRYRINQAEVNHPKVPVSTSNANH